MTQAPPGKTLPYLDWLRFLAAFAVVVSHAKNFSWSAYSDLEPASRALISTKILFTVTRFGLEAVFMFFVLSGFLVGGAAASRVSRGAFQLGDYTADRLSRIYTPLLPALLLTAAAEYIITRHIAVDAIAGGLLSVQGVLTPNPTYNGPLWSLSYEVWFYVFAGALATLLMDRKEPRLAATVILGLAIIALSRLDMAYFACWLLGGIAFFFVNRFSRLQLAIGLLAMIGCALAVEAAKSKAGLWWNGTSLADTAAIGFSISSAIVVLNLAALDAMPRLAARLGHHLAGLSYSIYLFHFPVMAVFNWFGFPPSHRIDVLSLTLFAVRIVVSIGISYGLYMLFERHTWRVRSYLRRRLRNSTGEASVGAHLT